MRYDNILIRVGHRVKTVLWPTIITLQPKCPKRNVDVMTPVDLTTVQNANVAIQPLDELGQPAPVDGIPTWSGGDSAVCTVEPAPDGMSAVFTTVAVGTTTAQVDCDADLGAGVTTITEQFNVTVSAAEATKLGVTVAVVEKTPPATPAP